MKQRTAAHPSVQDDMVGFATLDDRGRVALPKATRRALALRAGSAIAYAVVDGTIVLIPQDQHLTEISAHAEAILEHAGLTVDDMLAQLPAVRADILSEEYGEEAIADLTERHTAISGSPRSGR